MAEEVKEFGLASAIGGAQQAVERLAVAEIESMQRMIGLANPAPGQYAKALGVYTDMIQSVLDRHAAQGTEAPKSYGQALESARRAARYNATIAAKSRDAVRAVPKPTLPAGGLSVAAKAARAPCGCAGEEFKSSAR